MSSYARRQLLPALRFEGLEQAVIPNRCPVTMNEEAARPGRLFFEMEERLASGRPSFGGDDWVSPLPASGARLAFLICIRIQTPRSLESISPPKRDEIWLNRHRALESDGPLRR